MMNLTKMFIPSPKDAQKKGISGESVWVEKKSELVYELHNQPVLSIDLKFGDRVIGSYDKDGRLVFIKKDQ